MTWSEPVIVCEKSGRWATALRRAGGDDRSRIRETRELPDCETELARAPAGLLLLEWSAARRFELAPFVERQTRRFPLLRVVVVADHTAAAEEGLAREAGAIHFISSPRALGSVVRLARRQMVRVEPQAEDPVAQIRRSLA
jgi:hypothetical protein